MNPFTTINGIAAPLMKDNVDTDVIIRINRLTAFQRNELGPYALESLRFFPDGTEDPGCVLNRDPFRSAPVLLAGRNFGCGSSREGAVWALASYGIRCVIAETYGDIFFANCFQNGLLPVAMPRNELDELATQASSGAAVNVDLVKSTVTFPDGHELVFAVDAMKRASLLDGMDDITRTVARRQEIHAWQKQNAETFPWLWEPVIERKG